MKLNKYYKELSNHISPLFYAQFTEENMFNCHLISAFAKCYEFNLLVNKKSSSNSAFFLTPALRGICEDIITLHFLKKQKKLDKNKILSSYTMYQIADAVKTQVKFFSKNNKHKIIFNFNRKDEVINEMSAILGNEWSKIGNRKDKLFPSVSQMAVDGGLLELYEYLYSATSDMVHFSPHNLMRSGWRNEKSSTLHHFSTENFSEYYNSFNEFYGSYLFVKYCTLFKKDLKLKKEALDIIDLIKDEINFNPLWPELVTFEEMDVPEIEYIKLTSVVRKARIIAKEMNVPLEDVIKELKQAIKDELEL